jgi:mannose-6-phosphate isomerase-like protein (cupin superfamily)
MRDFVLLKDVSPRTLNANHDGYGPIEFRRLLNQSDFSSPIDFVDFTIIPAGSTIGAHRHDGNDEIYFIVEGSPRVAIDGNERRLEPGGIAVVRSGQTHGLVNDSKLPVKIFVIQVRQQEESRCL